MNRDHLRRRTSIALAASFVYLVSTGAHAAGVKALFDLSAPETAPFPTDLLTKPAADQMTGVQVHLPEQAGCAPKALPTESSDIGLDNEPDGSSLQPRLSIP